MGTWFPSRNEIRLLHLCRISFSLPRLGVQNAHSCSPAPGEADARGADRRICTSMQLHAVSPPESGRRGGQPATLVFVLFGLEPTWLVMTVAAAPRASQAESSRARLATEEEELMQQQKTRTSFAFRVSPVRLRDELNEDGRAYTKP